MYMYIYIYTNAYIQTYKCVPNMEVAHEFVNRLSYAVRTLPPALNSDLKVEGTLEHHSLCHCKAWEIWTSLHGSYGLEEHGGALAKGVQ